VKDAAIFSNYLSFKTCFDQIKPGKKVVFNFSEAKIIDHTLLEHLHHFEEDYHNSGGHVVMHGMGKHKAHSTHPLATRKISVGNVGRMEFKLNNRQVELRDFAEANDFAFYPLSMRNVKKYKDFPIEKGARILYEENLLSKYNDIGKIEISDITLTEGARMAQNDTHITVVQISEMNLNIPDFALEPEGLFTQFSELTFGKDIDIPAYPVFSKKYYLRSDDEAGTRDFFRGNLITFLEEHEEMHIESHKNRLLIYKKRDTLEAEELTEVLSFVSVFMDFFYERETVKLAQ
jgi:hypothetical protein